MREAFEKWISAPPYEDDLSRFSDDETRTMWPGQYRNHRTQMAWEAWQAAIEYVRAERSEDMAALDAKPPTVATKE